MLSKLLKYEIPAMGRKLMPLFIAWFATSVLMGLSVGVLQGTGFLEILSPIIYGMVTTAVFVMFIILIIQRYSSSLLGDEAYFNLTLPVSINQHIANKTLSALIWTFVTMFAALLSVLIIAVSSGSASDIGDFVREVFSWTPAETGNFFLVLAEVLIAGIFSAVKSILAIYAAITIGHQASSRTTLASIAAYIVLMIAESTVASIMIRLGIIAETQMNLFEAMSDISVFSLMMFTALIVTLALSAAYFFICKYLMEKRLNLA